jgi:tRNA (mo5U34)-methyltransferase
MLTAEKHEQALQCYREGRFDEAVCRLGEALAEEQTSELWNDWAVAHLACGRAVDAEHGFRRALECDPRDAQAAANLGALLAQSGQIEAAIGMFERALAGHKIGSEESATVKKSLAQCRLKLLQADVPKIKWWHSINLGNGIVTPGAYDASSLLGRIAMPERLDGLSVLDIGARDGYFSFEAERRGAARVLATDSYVWPNNTVSGKAGFQLARSALGSKVEDMNVDVMSLSPENVGQFDVVLFLDALHQLPHPLLALDRVRSVTKRLLIMETLVDLAHFEEPVMAFYASAKATDASSGWWGPNESCCLDMLKAVGFRQIGIAGRLAAAPIGSKEQVSYGRVAFHALAWGA